MEVLANLNETVRANHMVRHTDESWKHVHTRIFPEQSHPSAPQIPQGHAVYRAEDETLSGTVVRHLNGYELFARMCAEIGTDPKGLASDISACGSLLREHGDEIRSRGIEKSAAVFLGNVLVQQREDAYWIQYGDEFPSAGTRRQHYEPLHLLALMMNSDELTYRTCMEKIEEWISSLA